MKPAAWLAARFATAADGYYVVHCKVPFDKFDRSALESKYRKFFEGVTKVFWSPISVADGARAVAALVQEALRLGGSMERADPKRRARDGWSRLQRAKVKKSARSIYFACGSVAWKSIPGDSGRDFPTRRGFFWVPAATHGCAPALPTWLFQRIFLRKPEIESAG